MPESPSCVWRHQPLTAQITDQQLLTAEDIQWQEAIVIIVGMGESIFLHAMLQIIRGIDIKDEPLWRFIVRGNALLSDYLLHDAGQLPGCGVLPAAQGRRTGQRSVTVKRRLQCKVLTQGLVIVQNLFAQGQAVDTLA